MQAFPGAYGWGAESVGGRGGDIIPVTNLDDSGLGSLRDALASSAPRIIVFRVAGEIDFTGGNCQVTNPYVTIAGQTAPGSGISYRGASIRVRTHNVIGRYMRYRGSGRNTDSNGGVRRVSVRDHGCHDIILDHCSLCWGLDDLIGINAKDPGFPPIFNVTIQNCLLGENDPGQDKALLIGTTWGAGFENIHHLSIHNNLFASVGERSPNMKARHLEVINNVIYNFDHRAGDLIVSPDETEGPSVDYVNNYLWRGLESESGLFLRYDERPNSNGNRDDPAMSLYIEGNIVPVGGLVQTNPILDPTEDNWPLVTYQGDNAILDTVHRRATRLAQPSNPIPVIPATEALTSVLADAGSNRRLNGDGSISDTRDAVDQRLVADVENDAGPSPYPSIPGTLSVVVPGMPWDDADADGMSDEWEAAQGLDPTNPADGSIIGPDGYSKVEAFLNSETPINGGGPVSVVTDLEAVETALRQEALDLTVQADAVAKAVVDLKAIDDVLDAAADVIEAD